MDENSTDETGRQALLKQNARGEPGLAAGMHPPLF